MLNSFRLLLLKVSIPISKIIVKIRRPETLISYEQELDMRSKLENGDVIESTTYWEFSNLFVPGIFKHCGIYINGMVYEATTHGTRLVPLATFIYKKDVIGICRYLKQLSVDDVSRGAKFMVDNLGEPYDLGFTFKGTESWYCSKYARDFFIACDPSFKESFEIRKVLGEPTVKPDDFWLASKHFKQIASYNMKGSNG